MNGRPHGAAQDRSAIRVPCLKQSVVPNQNLDHLQLSPIGRPVKRIQSGIGSPVGIDSLAQEILHYLCVTVETRARERFVQSFWFIGEQPVFVATEDWTR